MVNAKLTADSIKVGTKVYTVSQPSKLNKYGCPIVSRVKGDLVVLECMVNDITFTMRYDCAKNSIKPTVLFTLGASELIPGRRCPYYRTLEMLPAEKCFLTYEEALHALEEMKGEEK